MLVTSLNPVSFQPCFHFSILSNLQLFEFELILVLVFQKIGYDNAAAVAKKAHKEGTTLKVIIFLFLQNFNAF